MEPIQDPPNAPASAQALRLARSPCVRPAHFARDPLPRPARPFLICTDPRARVRPISPDAAHPCVAHLTNDPRMWPASCIHRPKLTGFDPVLLTRAPESGLRAFLGEFMTNMLILTSVQEFFEPV